MVSFLRVFFFSLPFVLLTFFVLSVVPVRPELPAPFSTTQRRGGAPPLAIDHFTRSHNTRKRHARASFAAVQGTGHVRAIRRVALRSHATANTNATNQEKKSPKAHGAGGSSFVHAPNLVVIRRRGHGTSTAAAPG